jgi:hypothetical protein
MSIRDKSLRRMWLAVVIVFLLGTSRMLAAPQDQGAGTITVGILPFDDASGTGISNANIGALGNQLRAQLIRSGQLTPRMLTLGQGMALPLDPQPASELGRSAKVDFVVAPTIVQAESKSSQKGASSGRSVFGVSIGGVKATTVNAEARIQVELIRVSDGQQLDRFTVEGKKSASSVSTDAGGLSSAEASSPNFQSSPLGQALKEAMEKLAEEIEKRSPKAIANGSGAPNPSSPSTGSNGQNLTPTANAASASSGGSRTLAAPSGGGNAGGIPGMRPFSADEVTVTGKQRKAAKVYASETAMRMDGEDNKGKKVTTIMRFDRKVMWSLVPDQKMYIELPWTNQSEWAAMAQGAQVQKELLGAESVGSYACEKVRIRVTLEGHEYTSIQWEAKELDGFVVKAQDEKGHWSREYSNVRLGPQDASLFEIPAGYQKMSLFGNR